PKGGRSLIEQLAGQFLGTSRRDDDNTRSGNFRSNRASSSFVPTENRGNNLMEMDGMVGQVN
uniref:Movement protein n=1 Tax=Meloidogyne hapla TaxID=6305 RepID=A0A1I8BMB6_MELHA